MTIFTPEQKEFISERVIRRVDALTANWERKGQQYYAVMIAVKDAIANLPTRPDKAPVHRRWWQLRRG